MKQFLFMLKQLATLICWLCVAISCIGSTTTGDGVFVVTGIVGLVTVAWSVYNFIRSAPNK